MEVHTYQVFCRKCDTEVFPSDFRSDASLRAAAATGLCQECQDFTLMDAYFNAEGEEGQR